MEGAAPRRWGRRAGDPKDGASAGGGGGPCASNLQRCLRGSSSAAVRGLSSEGGIQSWEPADRRSSSLPGPPLRPVPWAERDGGTSGSEPRGNNRHRTNMICRRGPAGGRIARLPGVGTWQTIVTGPRPGGCGLPARGPASTRADPRAPRAGTWSASNPRALSARGCDRLSLGG